MAYYRGSRSFWFRSSLCDVEIFLARIRLQTDAKQKPGPGSKQEAAKQAVPRGRQAANRQPPPPIQSRCRSGIGGSSDPRTTRVRLSRFRRIGHGIFRGGENATTTTTGATRETARARRRRSLYGCRSAPPADLPTSHRSRSTEYVVEGQSPVVSGLWRLAGMVSLSPLLLRAILDVLRFFLKKEKFY